MGEFRVVLQDLAEVEVPDSIAYFVSDAGDLVFTDGDHETERFEVGTWIEVRVPTMSIQLRQTWPPENLDDLMRTLLDEIVVRFGLGGYETSRTRSKYASPLFNDFDAFVEELLKDEGLTPPYDRGYRDFFERAVSTTFGATPPRRRKQKGG